jgi:PAS domain S-box-containing protein
MESSSRGGPQPRPQGAGQVTIHLHEPIGRADGMDASPPPRLPRRERSAAERFRSARRAVERTLRLGAKRGMPVDTLKRIRLCNVVALGGAIIMGGWTAVEALFGTRSVLPWELLFTSSFVAVLALNAVQAHRTARILLVVSSNLCVFVGAMLFTESSGGMLPFFAMAAIPLLLFGPDDWGLAAAGAVLPALLLAVHESGLALRLLAIDPKPAPSWYFAANAATTFALAFLVPFFFFRANLRAEASLQRMGQEKLKRVIDSDLIGVVRGRLSGRIEDANDTFLCLLGYTRQDLAAGALDLRMIAPLDPFESELRRRGPTSVYERSCRRKDGSQVPTLVGIALLDESDDEVVGFVLDLTAQKHLEAESAMLRDSQEALRLRDLFNSIASHELKTPLTALLLNLQILGRRLEKEAPENSTLKMQLGRCDSAATRMGDLIHALLDVAHIHRAQLSLDLREVDVVESVRKVVNGFEVGKDRGPRPITVRADGPLSARVDPLRFDQIVTNLVSNALKYGACKPVEVRLRHDRTADLVHLEVIDRGPGIDPAMRDKIFEPFQRAKTTEPIPGLGLGLYVVKLIVEGHGGRIDVDSLPGQGTRFIVEIPRAGGAQPFVH